MFEKFTDRARRVVVLSQESARQLNHGYIGTEHLLLGLLAEEEGLGSRTLRRAGLDRDTALAAVRRIVPEGVGAPTGHIPFTQRAKVSLDQALRSSLQMGHAQVGTEHVLLGLLHDATGVGATVIAETVPLTTIRSQVLALVNKDAPGSLTGAGFSAAGQAALDDLTHSAPAERGRQQATISVVGERVVLTFADEALVALAKTRVPTDAHDVAFLDGPTGAAIERAWSATHEALQALPPVEST